MPVNNRALIARIAAVATLLFLSTRYAFGQTTVALTTTVSAKAVAEEIQLAANLLALLEVEASQHSSLQVVERQQLDLALYEQVVNNTNNDQQSLQLGKLSAAELILTAKLLKADREQTQYLLVRVTESKTAVVRGATTVPISTAEIEDRATEIVEFLRLHLKEKRPNIPTIAVLPFESVERFDRLRPLERGLRDLLVSALMKQDNCRVVQRSSMQQLLAELQLVRAGLTNDGKGLAGETEREAAYVVRGEIDEQLESGTSTILLRIELLDARSQREITSLDFSVARAQVSAAVINIAETILAKISSSTYKLKQNTSSEQQLAQLYEQALRDVYRLRRHNVWDASYSPFRVPNTKHPSGVHSAVKSESELGGYLLKKSVDRLETLLFLQPDEQKYALPLAYCLSFHVEEVWNPQQCEKLLRRLRAEFKSKEYYQLASFLLADMYFPDKGCIYSYSEVADLDPELVTLGFQRRLEVFRTMRADCRNWDWIQLLRTLRDICRYRQDVSQWQELLQTTIAVYDESIEQSLAGKTQLRLADQVASIAKTVLRQKGVAAALQDEAQAYLEKWKQSSPPLQRGVASHELFRQGKLTQQEYLTIIDTVYSDQPGGPLYEKWMMQKIMLAKYLREQGNLTEAIKLLESFQPVDQTVKLGHDFVPHSYGYELGQCYQRIGRWQDALDTYLKYIELPWGYGSGFDFESRIKALGGVPLQPDRDINVSYPDLSPDKPLYCKSVVTDGTHVFCAGGLTNGRYGKPIRSVRALNMETGTWKQLGGPDDRVSCMAVAEGYLWAGTDQTGLWRIQLADGQWYHWTTEDGLPTNTVIDVQAHGRTAFASIGTTTEHGKVISGGVVRVGIKLDSHQSEVEVYRDDESPQTAPKSMALQPQRLVAAGLHGRLHTLDLKTNRWKRLSHSTHWSIASGDSGIWWVKRNYLASLLDVNKQEQEKYPAQGQLKDYPAGSYLPDFMVEHEGSLWICGRAWRNFGDSGLFRLDLETGKLTRYGPRQGFRYEPNNEYKCFDAVWAGDSLWVATSFGLAEVTERDPSQTTEETPVKKYASQLKTVLPSGWTLTANSASIHFLRKEPVLVASLYGRPPKEKTETEQRYLQRIGATIPLEINLSFVPRLSREKYQMFAHRLKYLNQIAKNGFPSKTAMSRYYDERQKAQLPIYFTKEYSVYVNGIPPQYTMHNEDAYQEMKQIFAKLKTVLQLYENADPLPY